MSICWLSLILFMPACGEKQPGPYFWKAKKDGKISYFLGTVHTGVFLQDLQCFDVITSKLENSDYLFVESGGSSLETGGNDFISELMAEDTSFFSSLSTDSQKFFRERRISKNLNYKGYQISLHSLCWIDITKRRFMTQNCSSLGFPLYLFCLQDSSAVSLSSLDNQIDIYCSKSWFTNRFSGCWNG